MDSAFLSLCVWEREGRVQTQHKGTEGNTNQPFDQGPITASLHYNRNKNLG